MENTSKNKKENLIIGVGTDHAGIKLKDAIFNHLKEKGYEVINFGVDNPTPVDYPDIAIAVGEAVISKKITCGILVCGTGIGISIAANKVKGIRAALCISKNAAKLSKTHNNANILVLAGRDNVAEDPIAIVEEWLKFDFSGEERHQRRIGKITSYET